jgi:hypothetical protein
MGARLRSIISKIPFQGFETGYIGTQITLVDQKHLCQESFVHKYAVVIAPKKFLPGFLLYLLIPCRPFPHPELGYTLTFQRSTYRARLT